MYRLMLAALFFLFMSAVAVGQNPNVGLDYFPYKVTEEQTLRAPQIQRILTYQGILKDVNNDPVEDGDYGMIFRLYESPNGGVALWVSQVISCTTTDGLFSVELGPIPMPFDTTYFISLQIQGDSEMPDRQRLAMSPYSASADTAVYAFRAGLADNSLQADTAMFSFISGTAAFAIRGARSDSSSFAWRADTSTYSFEADQAANSDFASLAARADSAAYADQAEHADLSDTALYSDISDFAIHSDTAIYAWISLGYSHWSGVDSALYSNGYWGIAKGGAGNKLLGDSSQTMINLGVACTTGTSGQNYYAATIAGGLKNRARKNHSTVSGGLNNIASGEKSIVGGGAGNIADGNNSAILGGEFNDAIGAYSAVAGGYDNAARDVYSFVGGGQWNSASDDYSTVAGGYDNGAIAVGSSVGGGIDNHANGIYGAISGGQENTAAGAHSVVTGGYANHAAAFGSIIGGGISDSTFGQYCGVFSGYSNIAGNEISDTATFVGGGYNNTANGKYAVIGGGLLNSAGGPWGVVMGGWENSASGIESVIGGGNQNTASGATSTIAGGQANVTSNEYAFIGGGANNIVSGQGSAIAGGAFNEVSHSDAFIGGGWENLASGQKTFIGGGTFNEASGSMSVITGGGYNASTGQYAVIGGGFHNIAQGEYSAIPGGYFDTVATAANYSMAFGRYVYINNPYRVIFFDGTSSGRFGLNRDDREGTISYPIHVGTTSSNGNGAYLSAGGAWSSGSSRDIKENFAAIDGQGLLAKVSALSITAWNYKDSDERHIGPMAEDFVGAFDVGVIREDNGKRDDKHLSAGDVAGVALLGVQELLKKVEQLESQNAALEKRIAELENGK